MEHAITTIEEEMKQQVEYFKSQGKLIEAQRIEERTNFEVESISLDGTGASMPTYSMGSRRLYVMQPDYTTVTNAHNKIVDLTK